MMVQLKLLGNGRAPVAETMKFFSGNWWGKKIRQDVRKRLPLLENDQRMTPVSQLKVANLTGMIRYVVVIVIFYHRTVNRGFLRVVILMQSLADVGKSK